MANEIRIGTTALAFLLLTAIANAQTDTYHPFPLEDAYWNEFKFYQGWCDAPDYCKVTYFINGDTIIDSLLYKKVYYADTNWTGYKGAIRESNKKVYFRRSGCPNQVLLYDFNFNVGDSIIYPVDLCDTSWIYYHTVISIDSVLLQDMSYRRRINFDGGYSWIEGMGTTAGLFYPYYWGIACICSTHLVCFFHNGEMLYSDESTMPCFNLYVSQPENISLTEGFHVYPNPFTISTTIEFDLNKTSNLQFTVYNVMGEMVSTAEEHHISTGHHSLTWSPRHLPAGLYYGVLSSGNGMSVVKMVKQIQE